MKRMRVRHKKTGAIGHSNNFNLHAIWEIIVYFDESDCSSAFVSECDVYLKSKNEWKSMDEAFREKDIITNNYNSYFREPRNKDERLRGWYA